MKIQLSTDQASTHATSHLVVFVCEAAGTKKGQDKETDQKKGGKKKSDKAKSKSKKDFVELTELLSDLDSATSGALFRLAQEENFEGKPSQSVTVTGAANGPTRITLLGLGLADDVTLDGLRRAGGDAVRDSLAMNLSSLSVHAPSFANLDDASTVESLLEGVLLANYRFDRYLSDKDAPSIKSVAFLAETQLGKRLKGAPFKKIATQATAIADGVNLARDLVNETPAGLTPVVFAKTAMRVGVESQLTVTVLDEKKLAREKMGLMLAVAAASAPYIPPRLVRLAYRPKPSKGQSKNKVKKHIVLVGKGLTFDSGGLDLKPAAGMLEMKIDMGGAAAVLGAMSAIGKLKPDVAVTGYLGCVENGIGGNAYHPGDILTSRKGDTVEVNNTDAEGRLVLADCIDYAITKENPTLLIDLATLTGACMVALGPSTAGIFTDDDELAADILTTGQRCGEDFWRLPLNKDLAGQLKSAIADTKNTGERMGGAITAGLFLKRFVDGRTNWAHLDIAGPTTQDGDHPYQPRGGAGFAVRTLVGLVASA